MKLKLALALLALGIFAAPPVHAQHGHSGGSSHGGDMGHSSISHSSSHESEADDHSGKHDGGHSHGSGSVADRLAKNTQLSSKLQSLLPPGTDLATASAGFKNLGQFVAAVHVSKNLGIPFDQLKAKMTGPGAESLGKAIQDLKPGTDAKAALKQAEKQAKLDLKSTDHDADEHTTSVNTATHDADDTKRP